MSDGVFSVRIFESRNIHSKLFLYSHAAQLTYSLLDRFILPRTGIKRYCKELRKKMLYVKDKLPLLYIYTQEYYSKKGTFKARGHLVHVPGKQRV